MVIEERFKFTGRAKAIFLGVSGLGLLLVILGLLISPNSTRFWASFLFGNFYFTAISITTVAWIAISYLAKAGWGTVLKRVKEAIGGYFIIGGIGLAVLIIATFFGEHSGMHAIYEWTHLDAKGFLHREDGTMEFDKVLYGKSGYLNMTFFIIRQILFFGGWYIFYRILRRNSLLEDQGLNIKYYNSSFKLSAGFMPFYAVTFCLFSIDWAMSLEPHWYSTMFEVNVFAGALVSSFTVISLIAYILKRHGYLEYVNENHFHDLGKLMFGFSIFWTYTWVGQFLLIWYANLPEEVPYYYVRMHENWAPLFWINLILNFVTPFIMLMMRDSKRHYRWLIFIGCLMLVGRFVDWFLLIMPGAAGDQSAIGFYEIGFFLFFGGIFAYTVATKLAAANLVPKNHPFLGESVHHEI